MKNAVWLSLAATVCFLIACKVDRSAAEPSSPLADPAQTAEVLDLGNLGRFGTSAITIARNGYVAGESETTDKRIHAFLWHNREMLDIDTLGGVVSDAMSINDAHTIVGNIKLSSKGPSHVFIWEKGSMIDLGSLGASSAQVRSLNADGQFVGSYATEEEKWPHAYIFKDGKKTALGFLPGDGASYSTHINNAGHVVGVSYNRDGIHCFLWKNGVMSEIKALGSPCIPENINDQGEVVGESAYHPFLWRNGEAIEFGTATEHGGATAINNSGKVVGSLNGRAFLWENGKAIDLNSFLSPESGWVLYGATAISDDGKIAGNGQHFGNSTAYLLILPK